MPDERRAVVIRIGQELLLLFRAGEPIRAAAVDRAVRRIAGHPFPGGPHAHRAVAIEAQRRCAGRQLGSDQEPSTACCVFDRSLGFFGNGSARTRRRHARIRRRAVDWAAAVRRRFVAILRRLRRSSHGRRLHGCGCVGGAYGRVRDRRPGSSGSASPAAAASSSSARM